MPEHLRGGFKSAGLAPFNPNAISRDRLSPSLVVGSGASGLSSTSPTTSTQHQAAHINTVGTLRIGPLETPVRIELRAYFVNALKPAENTKVRRRRRVELSDLGEVLTNDEVLDRLETADAEKKKKAEEKKKKAAERRKKTAGKKKTTKTRKSSDTGLEDSETEAVYCSKCEELYTDSEAGDWIGCDECDSWWHYWCAGLDRMLTEDDHWTCERHDD